MFFLTFYVFLIILMCVQVFTIWLVWMTAELLLVIGQVGVWMEMSFWSLQFNLYSCQWNQKACLWRWCLTTVYNSNLKLLFPGKRGGRPLHCVPPDLPTCPRHPTRSPMGHGRAPALFPSGYRTNIIGEPHTHTRTHTHTHTHRSFVPPFPFRHKWCEQVLLSIKVELVI